MKKYVITSDINTVYNTKAEADLAYVEIVNSLDASARGAFKFLYHVAPYYTK